MLLVPIRRRLAVFESCKCRLISHRAIVSWKLELKNASFSSSCDQAGQVPHDCPRIRLSLLYPQLFSGASLDTNIQPEPQYLASNTNSSSHDSFSRLRRYSKGLLILSILKTDCEREEANLVWGRTSCREIPRYFYESLSLILEILKELNHEKSSDMMLNCFRNLDDTWRDVVMPEETSEVIVRWWTLSGCWR